ncbi:exonuclease domain-containing protein [Vibrio sp. TBV020]|uniref:3'-5' exonuclease n=1 Tax=Vibrio sp. TBV020 TaxID=3137398 RepID=UPI0038CD1676
MKLFRDFFHPLSRFNRKRAHYKGQVPLPKELSGVLDLEPIVVEADAKGLDYLVLDFETTGLDVESDLILSMGWVEVSNGVIDLSTAQHFYLSNESQIKPETAVINHITPQMLEGGISIHEAMKALFQVAQNKVLVAHSCSVENSFIQRYLSYRFQLNAVPLMWFDTLCIEKKLARAINNHQDLDVSLGATRKRYQLPEYIEHNALMDAVATAELLLAQEARLTSNKAVTIGLLYRLSH